MKKNNKEKGSITLLVLIGIIFILIILGVIYFSRQNKSIAQEKEIRQIEKSYNVNTNDLSEEYNEIIE